MVTYSIQMIQSSPIFWALKYSEIKDMYFDVVSLPLGSGILI